MSGQHSQEVQKLLSAEKIASEKIAEARKRKAEKLRQAKLEANLEIDKFKAERKAAFDKYEIEHMGSKDDVKKQIDTETEGKIQIMSDRVNGCKATIVTRLIEEVVTNIEPCMHRNHKAQKAN